ncbi:MAG: peptide ABC transporter substrate-binding protein [Treponema sp.]|nr:peptide ABC transporter substrate-binding protein [Treponema sp.]
MKMKNIFRAVLSVALLVPAFSAPVFSPQADKESDDIPGVEKALQRNVVMLTMGHAYDLDPQTASYTSEAQLLSGLYEGLFSYNPVTLEPQNALCSSYKLSRNKKRWTFTIIDGAKFSSGEKITASTFRESWLNLLSNPRAPYASLLDCIEGARNYRLGKGKRDEVGITARDEKTLVIHLEEPAEHLPKILCHHAFSAVSKKKDSYSGAFALKSYENGRLELVKNKNYRDASSILIPGITIIQSDDLDENAYLYNTGKVDWIPEGNVNAAKIINRNSIKVAAEFGTYYIFFKLNGKKWNTKEVREALLEAIPYDKLREGITVPATTLVYPLTGYPEVSGFADFDGDDAVMMMGKAREKAGLGPKEKLTVKFGITDSEFMKGFAQILQKAWQPLGVELVTEIKGSEAYNSEIPGWDADLFAYSWIGDFADPLAFLELFRSDSSLNVANYNSTEFDELLHKASVAGNSVDHYKLLSQAETLLLDDCVVIPVYHPVSLHIIDTEIIGGWQPNAMDLHPFKYFYIKRKEPVLPNLVYVPGQDESVPVSN